MSHDDSARPVKAQTLDELHSLQKKKSAPTTPIQAAQGFFSEDDRHKQQLQSISASLAWLTRETGPKVVRGDPGRTTPETPRLPAEHHHFAPKRPNRLGETQIHRSW